MAISFEDSKKQLSKQTPAMMSMRTMSLSNDTPVAASEETFTFDKSNYKYYPNNYIDDKMSYVDDSKNIIVNDKQHNVTQENNSQCIPFELDRYYDGVDLSKMKFSIHYVNSKNKEGVSVPINFSYSASKIRFGWLLDNNVTYVDGDVSFEIVAGGVNEKGENYIWRTRPNGKINILKALAGDSSVRPTQTWYTQFITEINGKLGEAKAYADQAAASAQEAQEIADSIRGDIQNQVKEQLDPAINEKFNEVLPNYYTKEETYNKGEVYTQFETDSAITTALEGYYDKSAVDTKFKEFNISDQLEETNNAIAAVDAKFANYDTSTEVTGKINSALGDYYNKTEVDAAIAAIDVSEQLKEYAKSADVYTKSETYSKSEVDTALANVDLSEYYTKSEVDNKETALKSSIDTNKNNIASLGTTVGDLQTQVDSIDKSPRKTYDVAYNDAEDPDVGENVFVFYEIENEGLETESREAKKKFTIVGGGGGGTSSTLRIEYVTTSPMVVTLNDQAIIKYNFSGTDSSGDPVTDGTATWKIAGKVIATNTALAGENSFDVTDYLVIGTQKVNLTITDDAGSLVSKTWSVQKVDVRIDSGFNDKLVYPIGPISFDYTPYGAVAKTVHFKLDGVEIGTVDTAVSGIPMAYTLPEQTHGAHLLEVYITALINGNTVESNHILKDIIWYDEQSDVPVISCVQQNFTARQYDATNISYTVYDPKTETPTVILAVDGDVISTLKIDSNTQTWQYKSIDVGPHVLTITCGVTVKTLNVIIEELDINVEPVTAGLEFDFNPSGKSNNDADRLWSYDTVTMSVSDNFDWINGGYQIDSNGDQYFCVKSGTTAVINYNLFADDPKRNGKEFKVVFKTTNIKNRDTTFISCMDNNIGLDMKVENARIYSSNNNLYSPYCEEDIIEFEFNINKDTDIPMVLTYEDGVGNRPMIYTSDASFMQTAPQPITIGSADCDVHIYRMKAYSTSLTDRGILSNFIADARNADEMIARYNRNQIYNENGLLTPEVLAEKCPDLRIIMVDAPWFTNDKKNKVENTNVTMIYKNGDPVLDNWTCTGAQHSGQGTSSNEYGYAGRNIDLIMNKDTSLFTLGDGKTTSKTITLTRDSVPTNYLNVKVNIASSENENNAQLAERYNEYNPFVRTAKLKDSKVKDTMEFYNCVVFIRERNEDIATHREFQDCEWHYYALGNVGDSKKTDNSRVNDKNDPKEFVVEILDYNVPLAEFPTGYFDEDGKKAICPISEWKAGNTAYDYLYADYTYSDGEFESFGTESYEFRYEMKGLTDEQREVNINAWREMYKFIVTSTDEEFYANLKKYFVIDSALYYYLFTERYTMCDNRAKNSFWHYGKTYYTTEEAITFAEAFGNEIPSKYINDEMGTFNGGYRFDLAFDYDND